jgi:hypothetical protein
MSTTRALDLITHDINFPDGSIAIIFGIDAIVQAIKTRLLFFLGEWFLDTTVGVPWFDSVLKKGVNPKEIASLLKTEILQTDGVNSLLFFDIDFQALPRTLNVTFRVDTTEGTTGEIPFEFTI